MKLINFVIILFLALAFQENNLRWVIEPNYDEIIVYGESSFVANDNGAYKVLNYHEQIIYKFDDAEIVGIDNHPNEGGDFQEIISIKYRGNKSRLFNIKTLKFLNEQKYTLLQTEGYYKPERKLIRVMDDLKEGVMDINGNMLLPPIYEDVFLDENIRIGYKKEEIEIFNGSGVLINKLPYSSDGACYLKENNLLKVQEKVQGVPNVYKRDFSAQNDSHGIKYVSSTNYRLHSGIVDLKGDVIIPFIYTSIFEMSGKFLKVTKDANINCEGFALEYFSPKYGIIDCENNLILPTVYKWIGVIEGNYVLVENTESKRAIFNLTKRQFETDFIFDSYLDAELKMDEIDEAKSVIRFRHNGLFGLKNKDNKILIPAVYRYISPTINPEIYHVSGATDDKYGNEGYYHIGLNKEIVPTIYADRGGIGGFHANHQKDIITVMDLSSSRIGYYKLDGTKISDPIYLEGYSSFSENILPVLLDYSGKFGAIDTEGDLIYGYIFDSMTSPYNGKSIVSYNGKFGILDTENQTRN